HVGGRVRRQREARARREAADQHRGVGQGVLVDVERVGERREVVGREGVEVIRDDGGGGGPARGGGRQGIDLQCEALLDGTGADARGLEVLYMSQRDLELVHVDAIVGAAE